MAGRRRLDAELVRRGLATSRADAAQAIDDRRITVNGALAEKAGRLVDPADAVERLGPPPRFVSRGGVKLEHALEAFGVDVHDLRAVDVGASTGGFTDCLLQRGAAHVVALDVGVGQLHERIRADDRVTVIERCNVRHATADVIGGRAELLVADLSFISLRTVMPALVGLCQPGAPMILLVKPQFEAGRAEVAKGRGVVTDPVVHERVRDDVITAAAELGAELVDWTTSPITGADGNVEFLVRLRCPDGPAR